MPLEFVRHSARFRANVRCVGSALARGAAQSRGGHFFKHLAGRPRQSGRRHMTKCPSPITVIFFAIFTGPNVPAVHPDAAYSMSSRVYGGPWTMWKDAADDAANSQWHDECTALLRPFNIGYYVGESDTVHRPSTPSNPSRRKTGNGCRPARQIRSRRRVLRLLRRSPRPKPS